MALVLIVEDSTDVRGLLSLALRNEGYATLLAGHGREALELLHASPTVLPQLILLDLMMPVMDGQEFLRQKSLVPKFSEIPVLVLSAVPSQKALKGAIGFLAKPVDLETLLATLESVIQPVTDRSPDLG